MTWSGAMTPTGNDVLGGRDHRVARHRYDRVVVARCQRVGEVAEVVGEKRVHQREVGAQRDLDEIGPAVHLDRLLAFLDFGANAGRRQHAAEAVAAGADLLDQRALRHEIDLQVASHHLLLRLGIQADVAGDHLAHQSGADQLADADTRAGGVIGDDGEVALALPHDLVDQPLGVPTRHEAADQQARPVGDLRNRCFERDRLHQILH